MLLFFDRRAGGLDRPATSRLRPRHGRLGDHHRLWALGVGVGLRRKLELNNFAKSLFYYLFMYGVGLRVGPSFVNSLGRRPEVHLSGSCVLRHRPGSGRLGAKFFDLPPGAAGGMLAGSQTMSAAIGSAEQAVTAGVVTLPPGGRREQVTAMIALSYGITYIWGTVGIILISNTCPVVGHRCPRRSPRIEKEHGVAERRYAGLSGWTPGALRAYRLENHKLGRADRRGLSAQNPEYRVVNLVRGGPDRRRRTTCDAAAAAM